MTSYRPVFYEPTEMPNVRIPIGALVLAGGRTEVVVASALPHAACIGGRVAEHHVREQAAALEGARSVEELLARTGSEIVIGDERELRIPATDAVAWVRDHALPTPGRKVEKVASGRTRELERRVFSEGFLRAHKIAGLVHPTFKPTEDLVGWFPPDPFLGQIEQWVPGTAEVLLMEPLAPTLSAFAKHVGEARRRLGAFDGYVQRHQDRFVARRPRLVAYFLTGGKDSVEREQAVNSLKEVAEVYDVANRHEARRFVQLVRDVGEDRKAPVLH